MLYGSCESRHPKGEWLSGPPSFGGVESKPTLAYNETLSQLRSLGEGDVFWGGPCTDERVGSVSN